MLIPVYYLIMRQPCSGNAPMFSISWIIEIVSIVLFLISNSVI